MANLTVNDGDDVTGKHWSPNGCEKFWDGLVVLVVVILIAIFIICNNVFMGYAK